MGGGLIETLLWPNGETLCWYECTLQGGRKGSNLDVVQVSLFYSRFCFYPVLFQVLFLGVVGMPYFSFVLDLWFR
jgi:hypothetical protein